MSYGPWSPHNKYAPGLGGKLNGQIDSILKSWRKHGIGVVRDRSGRR